MKAKEGDAFGAGRAYEKVATLTSVHLGDYRAMCETLEQAADWYLKAGKPDSSCRVWLLIADTLENKLQQYNSEAVRAYRKCIDIHVNEGKDRSVLDELKQYLGFLGRHLDTDEAGYTLALHEGLDQQFNLLVKLKEVREIEREGNQCSVCVCLSIQYL